MKLLETNKAEYLLVGGYAVGYYGYPRPTGDIDIWVSNSRANAKKLVLVFNEFGFNNDDVSEKLFTAPKSIIRMGVPPYKIEVITSIDGVNFPEAYLRRQAAEIDGITIGIISLEDLKINKKASGRLKDLNDLENLP